jgi:hypothetical protein
MSYINLIEHIEPTDLKSCFLRACAIDLEFGVDNLEYLVELGVSRNSIHIFLEQLDEFKGDYGASISNADFEVKNIPELKTKIKNAGENAVKSMLTPEYFTEEFDSKFNDLLFLVEDVKGYELYTKLKSYLSENISDKRKNRVITYLFEVSNEQGNDLEYWRDMFDSRHERIGLSMAVLFGHDREYFDNNLSALIDYFIAEDNSAQIDHILMFYYHRDTDNYLKVLDEIKTKLNTTEPLKFEEFVNEHPLRKV